MSTFSSFTSGPGTAGTPSPADRTDWKRMALVIGLGGLSWVATYVGMLELIEANMGDLPLIHKAIIGFSVAMLMTMIVWLLDRLFAPGDPFTKACYLAGYIFLSVISVGFGFGFYWKVLESRGEASRSAESAITQVQSSLFGAATRLEQLQSTLDQLTTISTEKSSLERETGRSCPNSGPGDGPRRKMREDDAARFKFASDFVKGRIGTVKSDMGGLDGDLQKIVKDDRSVIDAKTGTRNDFLRGVGRKLDLTVTGFNAFRSDPQLKQIRTDLAERAEKTTITGSNGATISCPDPQLQMALRGVVRAIDQLPELEKPKIAAVEGSEATIEAFRRLTTTFFGLLSFKLPPSADELRELQKKAVQSVELQGEGGRPRAFVEQSAGLAKRDYVPLAVAIFVDLCLLLVSIGRPMNRFVGMQRAIHEAERGPVYPILQRFYDIHADDQRVKIFEVFRDVIFDLNGQYHVAVPLNIPRHAENRAELKREAQNLANICYALEGKGILYRPWGFLPGLLARRELKRRGSRFIECTYVSRRATRWSAWSPSPAYDKPAFKVYRFRKGAWQEMILGAVMGAAHHAQQARQQETLRTSTWARETAAPHEAGPAWSSSPADASPSAHAGWDGAWTPGASSPAAAEPRYAESHVRSRVLDELRPGARAEPDLAWPASPATGHATGTSVYAKGHNGTHAAVAGLALAEPAIVVPPLAAVEPLPAAFDTVAEPANNNTGPADRVAAEEPVDPPELAPSPNTHDSLPLATPALAPPSADTAQEGRDPQPDPDADSAIAVDEISGWFSRPRRKA